VQEFAYFIGKLKSIPEGDGTLLDHCCLLYIHEHAEANPHKDNGLAAIIAGHAGGLAIGAHTKLTGTMGDLFLTLSNGPLNAGLTTFPTAEQRLADVVT
jgi:hypothetical protein